MARGKKTAKMLTPEEKLQQALVPEKAQPYPIPENWCWTNIDSINQYLGSSVDPMKQPNTVFELYSVPSSTDNYPELIIGSEIGSSKQSVNKNDVLLCKINPRINRVWKVSQHTENELLASSEWIVVRNSMINPDYLMFCFKTRFFREFMLSNVSGVGGSLMRAQPKFVKKYPVPIAPIAEQQRIVDRIESLFAKLDAAKEKAQAVVDGFELRKSAILHKAFTGELTAKWRQEHRVELDSWKTMLFNDCIQKMQNGLTKRNGNIGESYVVLRLANLTEDGFDTRDLREILLGEKEQESYSLLENDVIMVRVNGSKDIVGRQLLVPKVKKWAFCDHIIRIRYQKNIIPDYMIMFSKSDNYRAYVKDHMVSSAGQNTISRRGMANMVVPIPKKDEQREIVRLLSIIFSKEQQAKETAEAILVQIDTMKKAILARAFRGELGTNDPAEESAAELLKTVL